MGGAGRLVFWNKQRSMPWIVFVKYSWHEQILIERCPSAMSHDLLETICLFLGFRVSASDCFRMTFACPLGLKLRFRV